MDRVHVGIRQNHTRKKDLVSGRDLVNFGPNLFGYQMAPSLVIETVESSFLCTRITPQHRHNSNPRCRAAVAVARPGGGPRSKEGGSNTGRRQGDLGIAADATAALAP